LGACGMVFRWESVGIVLSFPFLSFYIRFFLVYPFYKLQSTHYHVFFFFLLRSTVLRSTNCTFSPLYALCSALLSPLHALRSTHNDLRSFDARHLARRSMTITIQLLRW
jgi:hypothetical protein